MVKCARWLSSEFVVVAFFCYVEFTCAHDWYVVVSLSQADAGCPVALIAMLYGCLRARLRLI